MYVSGAFSDDLKLQTVFKHLNFKGFSSTDKAYYEETTAFSPFVHGDEVWLDDLTGFSTANSTGLVIEHVMIPLEEDVTVSGSRAWYNTTEFPNGRCVPPSFNQSYTVKLYESDGTQIFLSDASDPFFEYETCRLSFQDTHSFSTPIKITVYTYNGSYLGNGSGIGGASDHGELTGLGDDDHVQYLLRTDSVSYFTNRSDWTTNDDYPSMCTGNGGTGFIYSFGDTVLCQVPTDNTDDTVSSSELDGVCSTNDRIIRRSGGTHSCFDDSVYYDNTDSQNLFQTINAPLGTDPVADSPTDILNLVAENDITITGTSGSDTITIGNNEQYVNESGDSMTGDLNMTNNAIILNDGSAEYKIYMSSGDLLIDKVS